MSSSSETSSRIRQFGLYRTIDARTEEFLKLSKKRQIRQGCACAAASTAITVTVVVVILLIYEYAIAVEWNLVQRKRGVNGSHDITSIMNDTPFADRLDRSYFGFDQDYFERMPLLVNALQESNYIDPLLEMSRPVSRDRLNKSLTTLKPGHTTDIYRQSKIRRTSPRPFIFEYRSPTPVPFSKTYGSRSWVDSYRNAQRLQNIRQVIKYLEKTINAKMEDMYKKPSSAHASIAFSGVYVEPMADKLHNSNQQGHDSDMQQQSSNNIASLHRNHQSDPLFNFKPNNPGDVNLLADGMWRFSPFIASNIAVPKVPMFKKIPNPKRHCTGIECKDNLDGVDSKVISLIDTTTASTESMSNKPKSFNVMLNLYPFKQNPRPELKNYDPTTQTPIEKIYFTTSKPVRFQFRRKNNLPVRRTYYYKKPRYLIQKKTEMENNVRNKNIETTTQEAEQDQVTKMIVHVNVYSPDEKTDMRSTAADLSTEAPTTTTQFSTFTPMTESPFQISSGKVEDFHDGSSGVIPVQERTQPPPLPQVTTIVPFFETETTVTETISVSTNHPELIKFSPEDAKVPDHYINMMETTTPFMPTEINRRASAESPVVSELETLIIKLRNEITSSTTEKNTETTTEEDEDVEETTMKTYVPQINGHYRSFSSKIPENSQTNRKRRLEMSVTGLKTYVPMYVEIKRNKTKTIKEEE